MDDDTLTGAISGDPNAVHDLLRSLEVPLLRYVHRKLGAYPAGRQLSEEVVQDTLLGITLALPTYQPQGPFRAWVFGIARHKIASAQRYYHVRDREHTGEEVPDAPDPGDGPDQQLLDALQAADDAALLDRMLATLDDRSQLMLRQRIAGRTAEQIGRRLGVTANTVRIAQHRAIRQLQARIR